MKHGEVKKLAWGDRLSMTLSGIRQGLPGPRTRTRAVFLGITKYGELAVVRAGLKTIERYHFSYWNRTP